MASAPKKSADVRSRRAILDLLKQDGPQDASALAGRLQVTAMAVRQHLYALQQEGLVDHRAEPRPIGRPAKLWRLTAAADRLFPDAHADLTVSLIGSLRQALGDAGLARVLEARAGSLIESYRRRLDRRSGLAGRLRALAEIRSEEGYMASVERDGDDGEVWWLLENHCPICVAARECQGLCSVEQQVFQAVLGEDVTVERTEHIPGGARRCAYRVAPSRPAGAGAPSALDSQ